MDESRWLDKKSDPVMGEQVTERSNLTYFLSHPLSLLTHFLSHSSKYTLEQTLTCLVTMQLWKALNSETQL